MSPREEPILHSIGIVSRRTGLKPDLIRAWERRYQAIDPQRTEGRHRLYSDEDIERLKLLGLLTSGGHSIGRIARLDNDRLRALAREVEAESRALDSAGDEALLHAGEDPERHLRKCLEAINDLDARALELQLERAAIDLSRFRLIEEVLVPLVDRIGAGWERGELRPMHEHLATAAIRSFVGNLHSAYRVPGGAASLVVSTPAGQLHELGALIAACTAAAEGWKVTYLGPDLPAEEIVAAARARRARAVLLSVVFPADDEHVGEELLRIARHLDDPVRLLVGGRAAASYASYLERAGARRVETIAELRSELALLSA